MRSLPVRMVIFGLAIYAMNSELSQNVAASLEGWYADSLSWRWIYWQYCVALPVMFAAIWHGVPREPVNTGLLRQLDWWGLAYAMGGFAMLYAALDQGNRLDWRGSGVVVGLAAGGGILTLAFLVRELTTPHPFLNLRMLLRGNLLVLMLLLAGFRFMILSTAYIIPAYLQMVQEFPRAAGGPGPALDRPAAARHRPAAGVAPAPGRRPLGAGARLGADRRRLPDGEPAHQPMGDGRFPALTGAAGARPVLRPDRAGGAAGAQHRPGRGADHRLPAADQPALRRRDRHRLHAELRPHP
ncbi:hypothetical protein [Dankookia sp. P2]|uniref:hypothetical protein n=1 Tax=Dankookia sp. P2 TaxID=3423955 RepID=UPI003D66ADFF